MIRRFKRKINKKHTRVHTHLLTHFRLFVTGSGMPSYLIDSADDSRFQNIYKFELLSKIFRCPIQSSEAYVTFVLNFLTEWMIFSQGLKVLALWVRVPHWTWHAMTGFPFSNIQVVTGHFACHIQAKIVFELFCLARENTQNIFMVAKIMWHLGLDKWIKHFTIGEKKSRSIVCWVHCLNYMVAFSLLLNSDAKAYIADERDHLLEHV